MTYISQLATLLFMMLGGDRILAYDVLQTYRRVVQAGGLGFLVRLDSVILASSKEMTNETRTDYGRTDQRALCQGLTTRFH